MMTYTTIESYNEYLVNYQENINIIDYVKKVNEIKFNIDIKFIDEFIELVNNDDFCIHHDMLFKYGVITETTATTNVKRILDQYDLKINIDYKPNNNVGFINGGRGKKNEYILTPHAFKICLIRSRNTKIYMHYYLLLEQCIKYYNDYQNKLNKKYIISYKTKIEEKDTKISSLELKIDSIIQSNEKLLKMNEETKKYNEELKILMNISNDSLNEIKEELNYTNDVLDETKEELQLTNDNLTTVAKKLDIAVVDRVINTKKRSMIEYMVIMKNDKAEYKYYVIRDQQRYINKKKEDLEGFIELKSYKCVPNSTILFNLIKEKLSNKLICSGNRLNLNNITENDFLNKTDLIYLERKKVIV